MKNTRVILCCGVTFLSALSLPAEWTGAEFISVAKRLNGESEDRPSAFLKCVVNEKPVVSATLRTTALGVYEAYVNGCESGGFLKPGFTHVYKRRLETKSDVTRFWNCSAQATNVLSALVTKGWWRDQITGRRGIDTGFRCILDLVHADGSKRQVVTDGNWLSGYNGPVVDASIFGGETYDARISRAWMKTGVAPKGFGKSNVCRNYTGDVTPMNGKAVHLREDLAMKPVRAWVWKGVSGATQDAFGKVMVVRESSGEGPLTIQPGETLVVDFAQNAAAEPRFTARAAQGTQMTILPAEMLNDGNGLKARGNDGPEGSVYRVNLRAAASGARVNYTFAGEARETYLPRFSYFGFRYVSVTATAPVTIEKIESVPVTSVVAGSEAGTLVTGVPDLNRFIENVKWGHLSNYLSVPTDCPQRDERLGWTADAQVFAPAALYLADCASFLDAWMDDMDDSQHANGSYPSVAPLAQYGNEGHKIGWADAGIVVPWTIWKRTGDLAPVRRHWAGMVRFLRHVDASKYATTPGDYQYADWLSFEPFETCRDGYWSCTDEKVLRWWAYLGACYWRMDALKMTELARALGHADETAEFAASAARALAHLRGMLVDGRLNADYRAFQSANLFALKLGLFTDPERAAEAKATLLKSFRDHGNRLQTGFVSTAILMDTLIEIGEPALAYSILLQHDCPSWLYSVDQGATTVWERWNSYTKDKGFGPNSMNSFNHYAYGAVLGWMYSTMAGIRELPDGAGFRKFLLAPVPDRRIGFVKASYRTPYGVVRSAWKYEDDGSWTWTYEIPEGTTAVVRAPDGRETTEGPGVRTVRMPPAPEIVLELPPSETNCRNSEGDFAVLNDGSVLFAYSHYVKGSGGDHDPAYIATRLSRDGGRTWSAQSEKIIENEGGMNVMCASFLRLKDGSLALVYLRKNSEADCRPMMRVSRDEGKTWGAPVKCVADADVGYYVLENCRAERLKSGRIILPMSLHEAKNGKISDWRGKLVCAVSDDEGATWRLSGKAFATFDEAGKQLATQEPGIVQLKDGRLLMYARTDRGRQWFYYSSDDGDSWTKGEPGSLWGPLSPATVKRLSNGDLVAVWNDHEQHPEYAKTGPSWAKGTRRPISIAVSKDDGKTWIHRHTLEDVPDGWYCYFGVTEHKGNILLGYCAEKMLKHARLMRVPIAWLYAN